MNHQKANSKAMDTAYSIDLTHEQYGLFASLLSPKPTDRKTSQYQPNAHTARNLQMIRSSL